MFERICVDIKVVLRFSFNEFFFILGTFRINEKVVEGIVDIDQKKIERLSI
jgi:hypothetical protein